ncbi:hypothetical protein Tco_0492472 [Tanacetum coccineum]
MTEALCQVEETSGNKAAGMVDGWANCEDYVIVEPVAAAIGLYHIHAAGGSQKEQVGPAVELHHKRKGCVGCWAVRVGLADSIGPYEWSGSQKGVEKPNAYFYLTGKVEMARSPKFLTRLI